MVNFADADAIMNAAPNTVFRFGEAINDIPMKKFGAFLAVQQQWGKRRLPGTIDEQIIQLTRIHDVLKTPAKNLLLGEFWFPDIEVAGARDRVNSADGFFFAAKGGHNAEHHNHNDVGSFVMYYNGKPCLIDLGRGKYNGKTFSRERYTIMNMQSQYHNLPTINSFDQNTGQQYRAQNTSFEFDAGHATFSTDIAETYSPDAGINRWIRSYYLQRSERFTITDDFQFSKRPKGKTTLNFMTYCQVSRVSRRKIQLSGKNFELLMQFDADALKLRLEPIKINDTRLKQFWLNRITRIKFQTRGNQKEGLIKIVISPQR